MVFKSLGRDEMQAHTSEPRRGSTSKQVHDDRQLLTYIALYRSTENLLELLAFPKERCV